VGEIDARGAQPRLLDGRMAVRAGGDGVDLAADEGAVRGEGLQGEGRRVELLLQRLWCWNGGRR
jgi:hypothetical protein